MSRKNQKQKSRSRINRIRRRAAASRKSKRTLIVVDIPLHKLEAIAMLDGEKSKGDELSEISQAFNDVFGKTPGGQYIDNVWLPHSNIFDKHVVGVFGRELFQIGYEITEDGVEFEARDDWVEVEQRFAPVKESSQ